MHDDFIPRRAEEPSPLGNRILSEKIQFLIQKKEKKIFRSNLRYRGQEYLCSSQRPHHVFNIKINCTNIFFSEDMIMILEIMENLQ